MNILHNKNSISFQKNSYVQKIFIRYSKRNKLNVKWNWKFINNFFNSIHLKSGIIWYIRKKKLISDKKRNGVRRHDTDNSCKRPSIDKMRCSMSVARHSKRFISRGLAVAVCGIWCKVDNIFPTTTKYLQLLLEESL